MSSPDLATRIRDFERELELRCSTVTEPTSFGTAFLNLNFPLRYDSSFVWVDRPLRGVDADTLEARFPLQRTVNLPGIVVDATSAGRAIGPDLLDGHELEGRAVLIHTGWSRHFGTPAYGSGHSFVTERAAQRLVDGGAVLVGIDSLNIDDIATGARPIHTALLGSGVAIVEHLTGLDRLPPSGFRFFAAELIRETALEQLSDEVPYSVACEIEEFREDKTPVYIRAVLHVERDSQKRILIGTKGERIRSIGQAARTKIESFLEQQVFLDLWVKVLPNWRKKAASLARFGYHVHEERTR